MDVRTKGRRTQAERSAATKERLLRATLACLEERGYRGLSCAAVCARAGVSRGAQLHHYPTKAALVAAAVEQLLERRHEEVRGAFAAGGAPAPREVLAELARLYAGPTFAAWLELVVAARTDAELRTAMCAVEQRFLERTRETFAALLGAPEDGDLEAAQRLVLAALDGLGLHAVLASEDPAVERSLDLLADVVASWRRGGDPS